MELAQLYPYQNSSIPTNQDSAFWANQTVRIWSPHLHETGQPGSKGKDFAFMSQVPWLELKHQMSVLEQTNVDQSRPMQSCLAKEGPGPRVTS